MELNREFVSWDDTTQGIGERNSLWLLKEAAPLRSRYESLSFAKPLLITLERNPLKRENKCGALIYFGATQNLQSEIFLIIWPANNFRLNTLTKVPTSIALSSYHSLWGVRTLCSKVVRTWGLVGWSFARLGEQQVFWREREIGNSIEDLQGLFL